MRSLVVFSLLLVACTPATDDASDPGDRDASDEESGGDTEGAGDTDGADTDGSGDPGPGTDEDVDTTFSLTVNGSGYNNHNGQDIFIALVRTGDLVVLADDDATVAGGIFSFSFPDLLEAGVAYRVDYFADNEENGTCDSPPMLASDHAWRSTIAAVTQDVTLNPTHNTDFTDVCGSFD